MSDDLRGLLADAAGREAEPGSGVVDAWWRAGRRRRRQRRAAIGAAAVLPLVVAVGAIVVTRSGSGVETLPVTGSQPTGSVVAPAPGVYPAFPLAVNPPDAPTLVVAPATIRGGDAVKVTVTDPPGRRFLRTPLTIVQRLVGEEWVTVLRSLAYTSDQRLPIGACGQADESRQSGIAGLPPWVDPTVGPEAMGDLRSFSAACAIHDFALAADEAEVGRWTVGLIEGQHRVCHDVAPVHDGPITGGPGSADIARAVRICGSLRVSDPPGPKLFTVDGPCPFPGDGTMPAPPTDPMAPQPNGVAFRDPAAPPSPEPTVIWKSSATNRQARRPGAAVALFDLHCTIVAYMVDGAGVIPAAGLDAVAADLAGAQARKRLTTEYAPFEQASDGPPVPTAESVAGIGRLLGTLRAPRLGYAIDLVEGTNPSLAHGRPGHVITSPLPGAGSNAVFHGLGGGFDHVEANVLRELAVGDEVLVELATGATFRYTVISQPDGRAFRLSAPEDADKSYLAPTAVETVTLMDGDFEAGNGGLIVVQARRADD